MGRKDNEPFGLIDFSGYKKGGYITEGYLPEEKEEHVYPKDCYNVKELQEESWWFKSASAPIPTIGGRDISTSYGGMVNPKPRGKKRVS